MVSYWQLDKRQPEILSPRTPPDATRTVSQHLPAGNQPEPRPGGQAAVAAVAAVTPGLRKLLWMVFGLVALLVPNSGYLAAITAAEWYSGRTHQNYLYPYMFLGHLALGLLLLGPFLVFAVAHLRNARGHRNRRAVRIGYLLFAASLLLLGSGLLLTRVGPFELKAPWARSTTYWCHVFAPAIILWLYWLHRLAGPRIRWRIGLGYAVALLVACLAAVGMHTADPRQWHQVGPAEGVRYFAPSLARTTTGNFIPAELLDNDAYCRDCHPDTHARWAESAHRFSSFNNPAYLASVRETREFSLQREGSVRRARWCAGCHDPVPFFSGRFDDPNYDDIHDATAHAGITCTVCHAISHVNSPRGNADYTLDLPLHYPFAQSRHPVLQWINRQLIRAKPAFHKKTFLKPFHHEAEFCSVCHKVHLPQGLNDYKFLRGQNHYDSHLLSGVSGHGARSFYYPELAEPNCNGCHMPRVASSDFGAQPDPQTGALSVHDHLFLGANTALPHWRQSAECLAAHQEFLRGCLRVDLFGVREGGQIDGPLAGPLRPQLAELVPGGKYLLETVIRTLRVGHHFTQGTADSNQVWLAVRVTSGDRVLGQSGTIDDAGQVDPWSHFVNVFMLDRAGRRIDRRNAQDIFVPLYDHQIPPGAAQTVHYALTLPEDLTEPVAIEVRVQYRKFDQAYLAVVAERSQAGDPLIGGAIPYRNDLPVTTLALDRVTLPVRGVAAPIAPQTTTVAEWERWNDYGIGLLLKGRAELRQAAEAFAEVERLGRYDGPLNAARVHYREGDLDAAVAALRRAATAEEPSAPLWTLAWLSGLVNREQGHLEVAEQNFREALQTPREMADRGFDFSRDYAVLNLLGQTLFDRARRPQPADRARRLRREAMRIFDQTLEMDPENVTAHFNLQLLHAAEGNRDRADEHRQQHLNFKADNNARDSAVAEARRRYPAANHAAEAVVLYDLQRASGPTLDPISTNPEGRQP